LQTGRESCLSVRARRLGAADIVITQLRVQPPSPPPKPRYEPGIDQFRGRNPVVSPGGNL
jgi:hypothetical protein